MISRVDRTKKPTIIETKRVTAIANLVRTDPSTTEAIARCSFTTLILTGKASGFKKDLAERHVLNVTKEQKGSILVIRLSGIIDETTNFEALIGQVGPELHVIPKEISRINSVGVKSWIRYFQGLKAKGTKIKFLECSTSIVDQINLVLNFTVGSEVESIYVPFVCTNCKSELVGLFKCEDLIKRKFKIPDLKCTKCSGKVEFDDIAEEYFGFLTRQG